MVGVPLRKRRLPYFGAYGWVARLVNHWQNPIAVVSQSHSYIEHLSPLYRHSKVSVQLVTWRWHNMYNISCKHVFLLSECLSNDHLRRCWNFRNFHDKVRRNKERNYISFVEPLITVTFWKGVTGNSSYSYLKHPLHNSPPEVGKAHASERSVPQHWEEPCNNDRC